VLFLGSARRAIKAAAESLFPKNDLGAPDFESTDLPARVEGYIKKLPPPQQKLIWLLFIFYELAAPLFALKLSRYSKLSVESRLELVQRFRRSNVYPIRMMGDALKGVMTMIYMSHPSVDRYLGIEAREELVQLGSKLEARA
jgi:hypothetical protein